MDYTFLLPISNILDKDYIIYCLVTYNYDEYQTFKANVFRVMNKKNKPIEIPDIDVRQWYIMYQLIDIVNDMCWPAHNSGAFSYSYFMYQCCLILKQSKYNEYFPPPIKNDK
jgi:hypothetical protein